MGRSFDPKDVYFHKAKAEGYRSRAFYKLLEIENKFRILKKGENVLDLGAAPGGWIQVVGKIRNHGSIVGVDLQKIDSFGFNVDLQVMDVFSEECLGYLNDNYPEKFGVVLSDMAPKTSGIKDRDQWLSVELNERVLELAGECLKKGGNMVLKIFRGADFDDFWVRFKKYFRQAKIFKPDSSRDRSFETYLVGMGWK